MVVVNVLGKRGFLLGVAATLWWALAPVGHAEENAPRTRTYYIAADEIEWNYAPAGVDRMRGRPFSEEAKVFVENGPVRIGAVYRKAQFREYADERFARAKPRDGHWAHLGLLGPVIRAEVGDEIEVVLRNHTRIPVSLHPHGVFYGKDAEGAPYADDTPGAMTADDAVPPGGSHTYRWRVPERAGPGPADPSTVVWLYHGHTNEPKDTMTGLIGPLIVARRGEAGPDGAPKDVEREFVTLFAVFDENESWFLEDNVQDFVGTPAAVDRENEGFAESNRMHAINGFVYGNLPMMTMRRGERVRWYVLGFGNEADLHTAHWHGNTGLARGHRTDVASVLPAESVAVDMVPDNPGIWMYHCHVHDHLKAGMTGRYRVLP